ncbi:MAG: type II toxin-antitoxin system RelE/ParE family toxin [Candidatus Aminicenantes bacterium]|nr:MAG: type II toxin-antitoxin system RelE/ParE family toxin [Candidatus Aminicenantes bacterium]
MSWTIKISSGEEKYYKTLDKKLRKRIKENILSLSQYDNPLNHPQVKPLTADLRGFHRLRVGDYRIIFSLIEKKRIIAVVNIFPQGKAY